MFQDRWNTFSYRSKKHVIPPEELFKILPSAVKVIKKKKKKNRKSKKQSENKRSASTELNRMLADAIQCQKRWKQYI